jgi:hypothetical protein
MITKEKLEIYRYYHGDVDRFGRGKKSHRSIMNDNDFFLIRNLIQNLTIIKNKLASKQFERETEEMLIEKCDGLETINELKCIQLFE